ncbi:MAG: helix-turn-helix domain-containing protein [Aeromicrobium sp.]
MASISLSEELTLSDESVPAEELTVEELSDRTGISVRNLRFYTTRGLVPPPTKRGRSAVYGPEHVARFELLKDLQGHGLNLAAIERYFEGIPDDATAEQIALHRVTVRPVSSAGTAIGSRKDVPDRGVPARVARDLDDIFKRHGKAMAQEAETLFRESLWPAYKSGKLKADQLVAMLDNWEQAGAAALVEAFSDAITETRRAIVTRRAGG